MQNRFYLKQLHISLAVLFCAPVFISGQLNDTARFVVTNEVVNRGSLPWGAGISDEEYGGSLPQVNQWVPGGGFEGILYRVKGKVTGVDGQSFTMELADGFTNSSAWESGILNGARVRIYRSTSRGIILVRTSRVSTETERPPDGGWIAHEYKPLFGGSNVQGNHHFTDNLRVVNGLTYYYMVKTLNSQGKESDFSNEVSAKPVDGIAFGPRISLQGAFEWKPDTMLHYPLPVSCRRNGLIRDLHWKAVLPQGASIVYNVQKGHWELILSPVPDPPQNFGSDLQVSDAQGRSDTIHIIFNPAEPAGRDDRLSPPSNLTAVANDGSVTLRWTASASEDATGYRIYRSMAPLALHEKRVYLPEDGPAIQPGDFAYFDLESLNLLPQHIGSYVAAPLTGDTDKDITQERVPHPMPLGGLRDEPHGNSCLKTSADYAGEVIIYTFGINESTYFPRNARIKVSLWLRQDGVPDGSVSIRGQGTYIGLTASFTLPADGQWHKFEHTFQTPAQYPAGEDSCSLTFPGPGTVWVDNWLIYEENPSDPSFGPTSPHQAGYRAFMDFYPLPGIKGYKRSACLYTGYGWTGSVDNSTDYPWNSRYAHMANSAQIHPLPMAKFVSELEFCYQSGDSPESRLMPWFNTVATLSGEELVDLWQYLAGTDTLDIYVKRRIQQRKGITTPWIDEFSRICLEIGNEAWHNDFIFAGFWGTENYGKFCDYWIGILTNQDSVLRNPAWKPEHEPKLYFILNGDYFNRGTGLEAFAEKARQYIHKSDRIIIGHPAYCHGAWESGSIPDNAGKFNDTNLQSMMLFERGEGDAVDLYAEAQKLSKAIGKPYDLVVYEGGPGGYKLPGSAPPDEVEIRELMGKSLAMAPLTLNNSLYYDYMGFTGQCFSGLAQGQFWTSHTTIGRGFIPHSGWLAWKMRNFAGKADVLEVHPLDLPLISHAGKENVPLIYTYCYRRESDYYLYIISKALDNYPLPGEKGYRPVQVRLPFSDPESIRLVKLTGNPRDNNREQQKIYLRESEIPASLFSCNLSLSKQLTGERSDGIPPASCLLYIFEGTKPVPQPVNPAVDLALSPTRPPDVARGIIFLEAGFSEPVKGITQKSLDFSGSSKCFRQSDVKFRELTPYNSQRYLIEIIPSGKHGKLQVRIKEGGASSVHDNKPCQVSAMLRYVQN